MPWAVGGGPCRSRGDRSWLVTVMSAAVATRLSRQRLLAPLRCCRHRRHREELIKNPVDQLLADAAGSGGELLPEQGGADVGNQIHVGISGQITAGDGGAYQTAQVVSLGR